MQGKDIPPVSLGLKKKKKQIPFLSYLLHCEFGTSNENLG